MDTFTVLYYAILDDRIDAFRSAWDPDVANTTCCADGLFLIHHVLLSPCFKFLKFMLENGADPNIRTANAEYTSLMYGEYQSHRARKKYHLCILKYGGNPYLTNKNGHDAFDQAQLWGFSLDYFESYLMVDLVCGEADNLPLDIWRVVKPYIYNI